MKLTPYPAYKTSSAGWLGDLPEHWGVRRLRTISSVLNGATPSSNKQDYWDGEIVWITPQDLGSATTKFIMSGARNITLAGYKSCATTLAKAGSLVVSTRAPIGHVAILEVSACVNQGCRLIVPESTTIKSEFLYFILSTAKDELTSLGKTTTFAELSNEALSSFIVPMPPLPEQTAIVRYLNHATERIHRYLNAKERLINLLEEQKRVFIHDAVTGRIDVRTGKPYPAYKSSGIDWLGEVPGHWHVRRLKWFIRCRSGDGISTEDVASKKTIEKSFPVIGGNGIMGFCNSANCDWIALAIGRVGALCGNVHIIKPPVWITDNALVVSVNLNVVSIEYLAVILKIRNLNELADKTAQPLITGTRIKNEYISLPPSPEQTTIVKYLNKASANIDKAIIRARKEIELLKEYRTRLIADVVTGKLDVREAAFKLPEAHDELSISDKPELQSG